MKRSEIQDVVACLDQGRTLFYYYKDRYCFDLLKYEIEKQDKQRMTIQEIRNSRFGRYLQKQNVKESLAKLGCSAISKNELLLCQPSEQLPFTLTVARWGNGERGWDQTTRNQSNLVLQLNFSNHHQQQFKQFVKPAPYKRPFSYSGHPIRRDNKNTLAWARMDISIKTNEVLIEEIQNDWLRRAEWLVRHVEIRRRRNPDFTPADTRYDIQCSQEELCRYVLQVLKPYQQVWAEAMLTATIQFIREEIGISNIYYHTFQTGNKLKAVPGEPPRSLYTKLPKQFAFEETNQPPSFIANDKFARRCLKAIGDTRWFNLQL